MVCKYSIVFTKLCGTEEDVLGPMLGALVRWVEVSKYKVSKHSYISLLPPSPYMPSINAVSMQSVLS
jgi:hypothetical protein